MSPLKDPFKRPLLPFPEIDFTMAAKWKLSVQETTTVAHLSTGAENAEIRTAMRLSEDTVKTHLANVYRKLDVRNRTAAVRLAMEHGILRKSVSPDAPESPLETESPALPESR